MTSVTTDRLQIDLRHQLKALSQSFWQLSARLSQAAKDLHDPGLPPSPELLADLALAWKDFIAIRAELLEAARSAKGAPPLDADKVASLKDLVEVLQSVLEAKKKSKLEEARRQAEQTLELVLRLAHKGRADFAPLVECQAKARELKPALAGADWANPNPELAAALLPFANLVVIVERLDSLDDEELERLQETTVQAFGKLLAVAAARGNFVFREAVPAPAALPSTEPAPAESVPQPAEALPEPSPEPSSEPLPELSPELPSGASVPAEAAETPFPAVEALQAAMASSEAAPAPDAPASVDAQPPQTALPETAPLGTSDLPKLATELYVLLGHEIEQTLPRTDQETDLIIRSSDGKKWLARCLNSDATVGETEMRDFYTVVRLEKAELGAIITSGTFTLQARQWARSNLLYPLDKQEFFDYLKRARAHK